MEESALRWRPVLSPASLLLRWAAQNPLLAATARERPTPHPLNIAPNVTGAASCPVPSQCGKVPLCEGLLEFVCREPQCGSRSRGLGAYNG